VRPPQQPLDNDSASGRVGEHSRYSVAGFVQSLIRIASPVGEQQQIPGSHQPDAPQQLGEI
jgi:hypothetical protein